MNLHRIACVLLALGCLLCSGCILSLNGLGDKEQAVFKPDLLGKWVDKPDEPTWTFAKGEDDKAYVLTVSGRKGEKEQSLFHVRLFELGDRLFLDMMPHEKMLEEKEGQKTRGDLYNWCLIPGHMIARIKSMKPNLRMAFLNHDAVEQLKPQLRGDLEIQKINDRHVITSPTPKLRAFLTRIAGDEEVWKGESDLTKAR
ncbi:MAG: hypothetical protein ACF8OB_08765 [Phycisphaeraceae bacterium JB051]